MPFQISSKLQEGVPYAGRDEIGDTMAAYYYTTSTEDPAVYHTNQQCSEGIKIEPQHRVNSAKPVGRRLCEKC